VGSGGRAGSSVTVVSDLVKQVEGHLILGSRV